MKFRVKALSLHLLASATLLTLILGTFYVGWYHWPGWYLADVPRVVVVMAGVDVVLGPLLTFIIATPKKPRRELVRDISIVVAVQLCALIYGCASLWSGRPLYYAYSEGVLQLVQAYDIDAEQAELGRKQNAPLAPHWYSLPRWIWAPLPEDADQRSKIVMATVTGGDDVISMPRYFKPWDAGVQSLRAELKKLQEQKYFSAADKQALEVRMRAAGFATDQANCMPLTGRGYPLLAVFSAKGTKPVALLRAK